MPRERPQSPIPSPGTERAHPIPTQPAADAYDTLHHPCTLEGPSPLVAWLRQAVESTSARHLPSPLRCDRRLELISYDLTFVLPNQRVPEADLVSQLSAHYGYPNPSPTFLLLQGSPNRPTEGPNPFIDQIQAALRLGPYQRYGLGVREQGNAWWGVVAFSAEGVELEAIPRSLAPRAKVAIKGRLHTPYTSPEMLVTPPQGPVQPLRLTLRGERFETSLSCPSESPGVFRVEILGSDAGGPSVLANFPLFCGQRAPTTLSGSTSSDPPERDASEVERRLFEFMNHARRQQGLPALVLNAVLTRAARAYSAEMATSQAVVHVSTQSGGVLDRVRASGLEKKPKILAENVGRAYSAREAHQGFMSSPGHRSNILHTLPTDVGIGVVTGSLEGSLPAFYITQIFAAF